MKTPTNEFNNCRCNIPPVGKSDKENAIVTAGMLGWTDEEMFDFKSALGIWYIRSRYGENAYTESILSSSDFWAWFLNHWERRDNDFLGRWVNKVVDFAKEYRSFHTLHCNDYYPHRGMLDDWKEQGDAAIMGRIIDQLHREVDTVNNNAVL